MVPNTLTPCRRCWPDPKPTAGFIILRWIVASREALDLPVKALMPWAPYKPQQMEVAADVLAYHLSRIKLAEELSGCVILNYWTVRP